MTKTEGTAGTAGTVLLTGGSGFVGRYVSNALLACGYHVRLVLRSPAQCIDLDPRCEVIPGDITQPETLGGAFADCHAVVHLVGIIREDRRRDVTFDRIHVEGTRQVVDAARRAGIGTFVHMSANGASASGSTRYLTSKWEAEELVRAGQFERWTIFRPSLIFGAPGPGCPEFASQLVDTLLRPFPIWPIFGSGTYRLQPVAVQNVAEAFVRAVGDAKFNKKTYCLAGRDRPTYLDVLDILRQAAGLRDRPKIRQPLWLVRPIVSWLTPTGLLPITVEQLDMLVGGNTCDISAFESDFGPELIRFDPTSLSYLRSR